MLKVAIYARYSTDNQSVASIEDQFRVCREHVGREGWQVVDTFQDAAISGARDCPPYLPGVRNGKIAARHRDRPEPGWHFRPTRPHLGRYDDPGACLQG
jgi:hypothetical protein